MNRHVGTFALFLVLCLAGVWRITRIEHMDTRIRPHPRTSPLLEPIGLPPGVTKLMLVGYNSAKVDAEAARGERDALVDLSHGAYKVVDHGGESLEGLPEMRARVLMGRYGIDAKNVCPECGCTGTYEVDAYIFAYNAVSVPAIERTFGHDVLNESGKEALNILQREHLGFFAPRVTIPPTKGSGL